MQGRVFNQYFKLSSCPVHGNFMHMLTTISYYHHFFELKKNNNNKVTIISFIYRKNTYDLICLAQETYKRNDLWSYLINQICLQYSHIDSSWHKCSINGIKTITWALFFFFRLNRHWPSIRGKNRFWDTILYGMNLMRNRTHK